MLDRYESGATSRPHVLKRQIDADRGFTNAAGWHNGDSRRREGALPCSPSPFQLAIKYQ